MAGLLGNLFDKDNPVKKLQKEIESIEFKKQSLLQSLQNDINGANQKIDREFHSIGKAVYQGFINGEDTHDKLTGHYDEIASQKKFVDEKEAKIKEISTRYDEELSILRSNITVASQSAPQDQTQSKSESGNAFCIKCGKPYTPGVDLFCKSCGQKLN